MALASDKESLPSGKEFIGRLAALICGYLAGKQQWNELINHKKTVRLNTLEL